MNAPRVSSDDVVRRLRDLIAANYWPDNVLPCVGTMAQRAGASKSATRAAYRQLEAEGVIALNPRQTVYRIIRKGPRP